MWAPNSWCLSVRNGSKLIPAPTGEKSKLYLHYFPSFLLIAPWAQICYRIWLQEIADLASGNFSQAWPPNTYAAPPWISHLSHIWILCNHPELSEIQPSNLSTFSVCPENHSFHPHPITIDFISSGLSLDVTSSKKPSQTHMEWHLFLCLPCASIAHFLLP